MVEDYLGSNTLRWASVNLHMLLRYFLDNAGRRVYTISETDPKGNATFTAHPARFSPDDKYSAQRVTLKKRFGELLIQKPGVEL